MPSCIATVPSCTLDPRMGIEVEQQHHPLSDKMKERPSGSIDNFIWFQIYSCSQISFGKYECNEIMINLQRQISCEVLVYVCAFDSRASQQDEAAEEEEGAGNPASLEDQAEAPSSEPRGVPAPRAPTAQERAAHELTHTPYKAWCEKCVEGKAREDPRRRRVPAEDPVVPLITMDYQFYSRDGKEVDEDATVLNLTDRATAWTPSIPVAHKGHRHAA